jgi:hypothetical protein
LPLPALCGQPRIGCGLARERKDRAWTEKWSIFAVNYSTCQRNAIDGCAVRRRSLRFRPCCWLPAAGSRARTSVAKPGQQLVALQTLAVAQMGVGLSQPEDPCPRVGARALRARHPQAVRTVVAGAQPVRQRQADRLPPPELQQLAAHRPLPARLDPLEPPRLPPARSMALSSPLVRQTRTTLVRVASPEYLRTVGPACPRFDA